MKEEKKKIGWSDVREFFKYDNPPFFRIPLTMAEIKELSDKEKIEIKNLVTEALNNT